MQSFPKIFLFLSALSAQAQSYDSLWKQRRMATPRSQWESNRKALNRQLRQAEEDKLYLSASPLGILDPYDTNLMLGAEYCLTPIVSLRADMGYIFHSAHFIRAFKTQGVVFRPMIRIHSMRRDARSSFDIVLHYKYVKSTQEDWLGHIPVNGVPSYSEFTEFDVIRSRGGLMLFYNHRIPLFEGARSYIEFYGGAGIKFRNNVYVKERPNSIYLRHPFQTEAQRQPSLTIQMGLRLVYKLPRDFFRKNKLDKTNYGKRSEYGNP